MLGKSKYIIFLLFLITSGVNGQNSASANFTASVTIIEPIEIQTTSDMNFAEIDARNGGIVVLNPNNTRTAFGDVRLKSSSSVSAAVFEVKGQNGYSYDINIPKGDFTMINGSKQIYLKDFTVNTDSNTLNSDSQIVRMGATIEIEPDQDPGIYMTPTPLEITVSYN